MSEIIVSNTYMPDCCAICFAYSNTCNLLTKMSDDTNIWKERDKNCPLSSFKEGIGKRGITRLDGSSGIEYRCGRCINCKSNTPHANYCMWCGRKIVCKG